MITYEDFAKLELKIATIKTAERVDGSEKLLKLQLDLGSEERQVVSGIAKSYEPEQLIGKQIVMIANLEPRSLMGIESNGMLLAASDESGPILLIPEKSVPPGTGIK
ncbi:MAG: methionine--tRNA ligase subunit beta [Patescibacteria group bacterium]